MWHDNKGSKDGKQKHRNGFLFFFSFSSFFFFYVKGGEGNDWPLFVRTLEVLLLFPLGYWWEWRGCVVEWEGEITMCAPVWRRIAIVILVWCSPFFSSFVSFILLWQVTVRPPIFHPAPSFYFYNCQLIVKAAALFVSADLGYVLFGLFVWTAIRWAGFVTKLCNVLWWGMGVIKCAVRCDPFTHVVCIYMLM